jgi:hypothetical protein
MKNVKTAGSDQDLNGVFLEQNTTSSSQCFELFGHNSRK